MATTLGGFILLCLVKAYFPRFSHPDMFYAAMAGIVDASASLIIWAPPRIMFTPERVVGKTFGLKWLDVPWDAISEIVFFCSPVTQTVGQAPSGGRRALGFTIKRDQRTRARFPASTVGIYGYDVAITSRWEASLDEIARQAAIYWSANGGSGEVQNRLPNRGVSGVLDGPKLMG